ncbi:MAG TPA: STAS-like domain-containing protein [Thermoanaerobaculia bacterium]|nr:STAS-like domain-containing protein [Thermoanaerobaculia bacterium]
MKKRIRLAAGIAGFAEDKEYAKHLRQAAILPALAKGDQVVLDFGRVKYATQSFVHALIGEPLKRFGDPVLDQLEFQSCSPQLRSVIELVVDYSLGGFPSHKKENIAKAG